MERFEWLEYDSMPRLSNGFSYKPLMYLCVHFSEMGTSCRHAPYEGVVIPERRDLSVESSCFQKKRQAGLDLAAVLCQFLVDVKT